MKIEIGDNLKEVLNQNAILIYFMTAIALFIVGVWVSTP